MPESLTPDLVDLRDRVTALAAEHLVPLRPTAFGEVHGPERAALADAVRRASKAAGVFGLAQPVEFGGIGAGALALTVARDVLGRHDVAHLPGVFGPAPGALADVGEPLRSSHLLPLLAGERQGGFAFTEPEDGGRRTWARADGDTLVVTGRKSYVTGGADADFLTALVDVEGTGPAMLVIDTATDGVRLVRRFSSLDGSHHAAFEFDEVRVPRIHVLGEPGRGMRQALGVVGGVRLALAGIATGLCGAVVDHVDTHLRTVAARRPELPNERVRLRYGELRILAFAVRSTVYRTARLVDAGGDDTRNEVSAAKVFATEAVGTIVDEAIQLVGGHALEDDHPLAGIHRRVRAMRLAEGATDVLRINVAKGALDLGLGRL